MEGKNLDQTGGEAGERAVGSQFTFQTLHSTSQDGSSLEFVSATAGRECNIQDARGGGLCYLSNEIFFKSFLIKF